MIGGHVRLGLVCVWSLLVRAAPAQERAGVTAQPTFARVETAAGEPLADALVTFAGCVPHAGPDAGPVDVKHVQTDARGRARAHLRPNLCYVAWAVGPAADDGRCAVAPARGWFSAGAVMTLRCDERQRSRRIAVAGLGEWAKEGPLQFVALTSVPGAETELTLGDGAFLVVPPGPFDVIEVRTAGRQPLWHGPVAKETLQLPPPQSLRVRVIDENGAGLAGAVVQHRVGRLRPWRFDSLGGVAGDRWRRLGAADADGRCTIVVPYGFDPLLEQSHGDLALFASVPGRPAVAGGVFNRGLHADDRKVASAGVTELVFTCRKAERLAGRIGALPAGSLALLSATAKLISDGTSYTHDARLFHAPVGADGTFVFAEVPAGVHACRLAFLPPDDSAQPAPWFHARPARELPPEVADGDGPTAWADLRLRVSDPGGGPARGAVAIVVPAAGAQVVPGAPGLPFRDSAMRVPLDPRGGAALQLTPGTWAVMVAADGGWGASCVDAAAGEREVVVTMQPMATMRVELRDDAGKALPGARVVVRATTQRGTSDVLQNVLPTLRPLVVAEWARLRTDAGGRITIPYVPLETETQRLGLVWEGGASADFVLEANSDWHPVRPK